jgi:hypothetical protein
LVPFSYFNKKKKDRRKTFPVFFLPSLDASIAQSQRCASKAYTENHHETERQQILEALMN